MATPLEMPSALSAPPSPPDDESPPPSASSFQRFFSTYSTFLSSFVIGAAGLIATTLYQTQQQEITRRQGEAQIKISELNAENQWRIERAEILAKNLTILSSNREDNVEPRYGVLLSLTRGKILDSELAVSYALELGSHNAEYMRSVLANVGDKNWEQIDHAYMVGCDERYGARRMFFLC